MTINTTNNSDSYTTTDATTYVWYDVSSTFTFSTAAGLTVKGNLCNDDKGKISAQLYFKYIKKKMGVLEKIKMDGKIKKLEKAFYAAVESGQDVMANKFLNNFCAAVREAELWAGGIKFFLEKEDVNKYKNRIKDGHISDTKLEDYIREIPKEVIAKKKKVEKLFDDFVIYHYYNPEVEEKISKKQQLSSDEKAKMRDPILFGLIKETNRLYFIADWEDEHCDLTFDELADAIGKEEKDITLTKEVKL